MWLDKNIHGKIEEVHSQFTGSLVNLKTRPLDWNISMTLVGELWPERLFSCTNYQSLSRGDINLLAFQVNVNGYVTVHKFVSASKTINHDIMSWHITTCQQTKEFWWVLWGLIRGPPACSWSVDIFDISASAFEFCQASKSVPNFHKCLEAKSSRITCTASWRNAAAETRMMTVEKSQSHSNGQCSEPLVSDASFVLFNWKTTFFWWLRVAR